MGLSGVITVQYPWNVVHCWWQFHVCQWPPLRKHIFVQLQRSLLYAAQSYVIHMVFHIIVYQLFWICRLRAFCSFFPSNRLSHIMKTMESCPFCSPLFYTVRLHLIVIASNKKTTKEWGEEWTTQTSFSLSKCVRLLCVSSIPLHSHTLFLMNIHPLACCLCWPYSVLLWVSALLFPPANAWWHQFI